MTRSVGTAVAVGVMAVGLFTAACGSPRSTSAASGASTTTSAGATTTAATDTSATSADSAITTSNGQCLTANLKVTAGTGDAATSHVFVAIVFTNTGKSPCTIAAYPGVSFVAGDDGHQVGDPATRVSGSTSTVTLAPGQSASASVSMTNPSVYDASQCEPVTVRGLRVYPPDNTTSAFVPLGSGQQACSGHVPDQTPLTVKPVQAAG